MAWWFAGLVMVRALLAQDGPSEVDDPEAGSVSEGVYEVRVYREEELFEARQALVRDIASHGWRLRGRRGDALVFRGPRGWMGRAYLRPDGTLQFTAPPLLLQSGAPEALEAARGPRAQRVLTREQLQRHDFAGLHTVGREITVGVEPRQEFTMSLGASRARRQAVRDRLLLGVDPSVRRLRDAVHDASAERRVREVVDALDALWSDGVPLDGRDPALDDWSARRREALTFWATRADTPQGVQVCEAVEAWLFHVVMPSAHPATPDELAAAEAEARHTHGRTLPSARR